MDCLLTSQYPRPLGEIDLELPLKSSTALVIDQDRWQLLYAKNPKTQRPIASITKLMTAMVVLDAELEMDERIRIQPSDIDRLKSSGSRLKVGTPLPRAELIKLALMASENRAAAALSRAYPGGQSAFVRAMNRKASELGMHDSHFVDPTGLNPGNVSTGFDLALLVKAAYQYPEIRQATTTREDRVATARGRRMRSLTFHNSNRLVASGEWDIGLSKTGYIREAGRCLVMQSTIDSKPVIIILLDSMQKATRIADANFIRRWLSAGVNDRLQGSTLRRGD
jgi:D-alanyl-D-alanine endopeptidase (penicillin-binding protein 7)